METVIIELSNKKASIKQDNGDYEVILAAGIDIDEGDEITIQNCFIDTSLENPNKITLAESVAVQTSHFMYSRNWTYRQKAYIKGSSAGNEVLQNDNKAYVLCSYTDSGSLPANMKFYSTAEAEGDSPVGGVYMGGFTFGIEYKNVHGVISEIFITLPQKKIIPNTGTFITYDLNIIADSTYGLKLSNTSQQIFKEHNTGYGIGNIQSTAITDGVLEPVTFTTSFTIPKGNYEPSHLASLMTEQFNKMTQATFFADTERVSGANPFLQMNSNYSGTLASGHFEYYFVEPSTNYNAYAFDTTYGNFWLGTNQVSLQYNEDSKLFYFDFLHFPLYDGDGNIVIIPNTSYKDGAAPVNADEYFYSSSNGGICFRSLEPQNFWKLLGFDLESILVKPTHSASAVQYSGGHYTSGATTAIIALDAYSPKFDIVEGQNITTGLVSNDTAVVKQLDCVISTDFPDANTDLTVNEGRIIIGTETTPILATNQSSELRADSGFYIVEIDCIFGSLYVGDDQTYSRNIRTIVNRYYTVNSFTSSGGDGIVYQHKGIPMRLQSFKVRIYNSDGSVIENVGPDNTVYMKLIKKIIKS